MIKLKNTFILVLSITLFFSCENGNEIDKEKPNIDISQSDAFPINCDTLYFGETFILKVKLTDNFELGSFSIDIHNNFDHHSHTTEVNECNLNPGIDPVNPYVSIAEYEIPETLNEYNTNLSIDLPTQNNKGKFDEGDYHFFISLTDKEGWSAQKGLSIKMLYKN
jgi:hypothetical protein